MSCPKLVADDFVDEKPLVLANDGVKVLADESEIEKYARIVCNER